MIHDFSKAEGDLIDSLRSRKLDFIGDDAFSGDREVR